MVEPWTPDLVTVARFLFGPRPLQLLENLASMGGTFLRPLDHFWFMWSWCKKVSLTKPIKVSSLLIEPPNHWIDKHRLHYIKM